MIKPMSQRILDWVDACSEKPLELPAMFGILRDYATHNADDIEKIMPSTGQFAVVYEDQLESSANFGTVTKDMIRVTFDSQVAYVINALASIKVERDGFEEDRDFALAFLYARGEHIQAAEKLSYLVKPMTSRMNDRLQEHQELLTAQGLDVDGALRSIAENAAEAHADEVGRSLREIGLEGRFGTMEHKTLTSVIVGSFGTIMEYEDTLRDHLGLPLLNGPEYEMADIQP